MKSTGMGALNAFSRRVEKRAFGAEKMTSSAVVDDEEGRKKQGSIRFRWQAAPWSWFYGQCKIDCKKEERFIGDLTSRKGSGSF